MKALIVFVVLVVVTIFSPKSENVAASQMPQSSAFEASSVASDELCRWIQEGENPSQRYELTLSQLTAEGMEEEEARAFLVRCTLPWPSVDQDPRETLPPPARPPFANDEERDTFLDNLLKEDPDGS